MTNDDSAGPPKPKTLSTAVVSGGAGAVAGATGVYAFNLVPSYKDIMSSAVSTSDFIHALTVIGFLMLLVLVTGYVLLQHDRQLKTTPVMWVGLFVFSAVSIIGFGSIVLVGVRTPTVTVHAYLGSGSDVRALDDDPPLNLATYLNSNPRLTLTTDRAEAQPLKLKDESDLTIDIYNFNALRDRLKALRAKESEARSKENATPAVVNLIKKACRSVPASDSIYAQCQTWLSGPEG